MSKLAKALTAAAGNAAGESLYVEDVFSTYLYTGGLSSPNVIQTNIDLAGEGGLVWTKNRTSATSNQLTDTVSGYRIESDDAAAGEASQGNVLFNSDGHSLSGYSSFFNGGGDNYASWTFRKAEKFFDVVTYTGNSTAGRTVAHNLGSVPACIIVKRTDSAADWMVYHKGVNGGVTPEDFYLQLSQTSAQADAVNRWNDTAPTSTEFTLGDTSSVNASGGTYVAYLFASDAGGFGDDGSESIIKCGSFTLDGSGNASIDCGFEPQWVLAKRTDGAQDWYLTDMMRGMAQTTNGSGTLSPNLSDAEYMYNRPKATATGFDYVFIPNTSYIYIAIRRPMKTPESGTEVFNSLAYTGDGASTRDFDLGMTVDAYFQACRSSSTYNFKNLTARLTAKGLHTAGTGTEFTTNTSLDVQDGLRAIGFENTLNQSGETYIINGFKRATGFFDVVAYTGDGVAGRTVAHNLGVAPELMIFKRRNGARSWAVYCQYVGNGYDKSGNLETTNPFYSGVWNNTLPTSTEITFNNSFDVNGSGATYIGYLFATLAGVSKVGSYTGSNNVGPQTIDCGFSTGARFVLIKNTGIGEWFVFDVERGITVGSTDGVLQLQSTSQEYTEAAWGGGDMIQPHPSGFTLTTNGQLNSYTSTYIFLAIA